MFVDASSQTTFGYNSGLWTSQTAYATGNYAGGLDNNEYQSQLFGCT